MNWAEVKPAFTTSSGPRQGTSRSQSGPIEALSHFKVKKNSRLKDNKPHTWTSNPKGIIGAHNSSGCLQRNPFKCSSLSLLWIVSKRLGVRCVANSLHFVISEFSLTVTLTSIPITQMPQRKQTWWGDLNFLLYSLKYIYSVLSTKMELPTSLCYQTMGEVLYYSHFTYDLK